MAGAAAVAPGKAVPRAPTFHAGASPPPRWRGRCWSGRASTVGSSHRSRCGTPRPPCDRAGSSSARPTSATAPGSSCRAASAASTSSRTTRGSGPRSASSCAQPSRRRPRPRRGPWAPARGAAVRGAAAAAGAQCRRRALGRCRGRPARPGPAVRLAGPLGPGAAPRAKVHGQAAGALAAGALAAGLVAGHREVAAVAPVAAVGVLAQQPDRVVGSAARAVGGAAAARAAGAVVAALGTVTRMATGTSACQATSGCSRADRRHRMQRRRPAAKVVWAAQSKAVRRQVVVHLMAASAFLPTSPCCNTEVMRPCSTRSSLCPCHWMPGSQQGSMTSPARARAWGACPWVPAHAVCQAIRASRCRRLGLGSGAGARHLRWGGRRRPCTELPVAAGETAVCAMRRVRRLQPRTHQAQPRARGGGAVPSGWLRRLSSARPWPFPRPRRASAEPRTAWSLGRAPGASPWSGGWVLMRSCPGGWAAG